MVSGKLLFVVAALGLSCAFGSVAIAQTSTSNETNQTTGPATISVPNGTPIIIEITDLVSTKTAKRDDMFNLRLAAPLTLNGAILIPEGTLGKGQVIDSGLPGMGGKPGKLVLAARYLEFEGRQIPIRGLNMDMGARDNSGTAVLLGAAGGIVGGVAGLMVTGGHMEVPPGTLAHAKLGMNFIPSAN